MKFQEKHKAALRAHANKAKAHALRAGERVHHHMLRTTKHALITGAIAAIVFIVLGQLLYPQDTIVPFTRVDNVVVGGASKQTATDTLDIKYQTERVPIYFNDSDKVKKAPTLPEIGVSVANDDRIEALSYPWYWRLIPTSLLWYFAIMPVAEPDVARDDVVLVNYLDTTFGRACSLEMHNASLRFEDGLIIDPAQSGGVCSYSDLYEGLRNVPVVPVPDALIVTGVSEEPSITTEEAERVASEIMRAVGGGVPIEVEGVSEFLPEQEVLGWLVFTSKDTTIQYTFDEEKAGAYLTERYGERVTNEAGITTVVTKDFTEVSRETGESGHTLNVDATLQQVLAYIKGDATQVALQLEEIEPQIVYTREYSTTDEGLSAFMKNFAELYPGEYSATLVELDGQRRRASYNGDTQYITASTYKLFVAYSTLLRIESGEWKWTDENIDANRDLAKCFDDMIVLSDNACAHALLLKIGFQVITNEARLIGAKNTTFLDPEGIKSTTADEALLLAQLQTGQILTQQSSRDTLIDAMKRNVYRQGIPKGVPNATVADKVGFLDEYLHDAAIVYSPNGTYVLVIFTKESSWPNIAEFTKQLEALRISS